jgi:hypothetical protein
MKEATVFCGLFSRRGFLGLPRVTNIVVEPVYKVLCRAGAILNVGGSTHDRELSLVSHPNTEDDVKCEGMIRVLGEFMERGIVVAENIAVRRTVVMNEIITQCGPPDHRRYIRIQLL